MEQLLLRPSVKRQKPSDMMRAAKAVYAAFRMVVENSIAFFVAGGNPEPTAISFVDFAPKSLHKKGILA